MIPAAKRKNIRNKKSILSTDSESDTDTYVPSYKKLRLERVRNIQKNLYTLYDTDNSSENSNVQRNNKRRMKVTEDNSNTKSKNKIGNVNIRATKENDSKILFNKQNASTSYNSNKSSSLSLTQSQKRYQKILNGNKGKNNNVEAKLSQRINDQNSDEFCNNSDVAVCTIVEDKVKQNIKNFKPSIIDIVEKLKNKFSTYKLQIHRLQTKYIKTKITLEDAEDLMFIFNSVISKLKEELTEQQQELTDTYIRWRRQFKISSVRHKHSTNNNSLQVHSDLTSDSEIFSVDAEQQLKVTKDILEKVCENNKVTMQGSIEQNNIRNNLLLEKETDSSEIVDCIIDSPSQTKNDNVTLQQEKNVSHILNEVTEINSSETSENKECTQNSVSNTKTSNKNFTDKLINCDSDISSTCSTVTFYPTTDTGAQCTNTNDHESYVTDTDEIRDISYSENPVVEVPIISNKELNSSSSKVQKPTLSRCESLDTIIIPRNSMSSFSKQYVKYKSDEDSQAAVRTYLAPLNLNKNSIHLYESKESSHVFTSPVNHVSDPNSRNKMIIDKKLRMNCQVLVKKLKW